MGSSRSSSSSERPTQTLFFGKSLCTSPYLGELLWWNRNCPGCPWESTGLCLYSLPLPGCRPIQQQWLLIAGS